MPRQETSRLKLSHGWLRGEDWWGDPVSDNFVTIDMLLNPYVLSMTEPNPPGAVAVGDMYIVPVGGADDWAGHDGDLSVRSPDEWIFATPTKGVRARLNDPAGWIWFNGEVWIPEDQDTDVAPPVLGTRYDIALSVGYEVEPLEMLLAFTVPEAMTLPNAAAGSVGRAMSSPLGIMRLAIKRNGVDVGTISFIPATVRAEFTVIGDKVFAKGDLLSIHVPESPPAGFQNYSATLRLLLNSGG